MCNNLGLVLRSGHRHPACSCPGLGGSASRSLCHAWSLGPVALPAGKGRRHGPAAFPEDPISLLPNKQASPRTNIRVGGKEFRGSKNERLRRILFLEIMGRTKSPCCSSASSCPKRCLSWALGRRLRPPPIHSRRGPPVAPRWALALPES